MLQGDISQAFPILSASWQTSRRRSEDRTTRASEWPRWDCGIDEIQKCFSVADVGEGMIVVGNPLRLAPKAGLDHRHVWQSAGGTIGEELRGRRADRKVLRTPQRQERDIAEIVTAAD